MNDDVEREIEQRIADLQQVKRERTEFEAKLVALMQEQKANFYMRGKAAMEFLLTEAIATGDDAMEWWLSDGVLRFSKLHESHVLAQLGEVET